MRVETGDIRDLYDRFGAVLRQRAPGWRVALVAAKGSPVQRIALAPAAGPVGAQRVLTTNGGLPIALINGTVVRSAQPTEVTAGTT